MALVLGGWGCSSEAEEDCSITPLDCPECPTLDQFRESCADAVPTTCGGTRVGPLVSYEDSRFTYCYASDGTLIGKVFEDLEYSKQRQVSGVDCTARGPSAPLCSEGPDSMLGPDSEALEIHWFNFFSGGYGFEKRLDQLSAEQLELARAIQVVPPTGDCWADGAEMSIVVSGGDVDRKFFANDFSDTCGDDVTLVDFEATTALLRTAHCLPAQGYDGQTSETAPSIAADDGCWHGLSSLRDDQSEWWFGVEISAPGEYRVRMDACGDRQLELSLLEADATTPVAGISNDGECPASTYEVAAAGRYLLNVNMLEGKSGGDFFLRVESTANE